MPMHSYKHLKNKFQMSTATDHAETARLLRECVGVAYRQSGLYASTVQI